MLHNHSYAHPSSSHSIPVHPSPSQSIPVHPSSSQSTPVTHTGALVWFQFIPVHPSMTQRPPGATLDSSDAPQELLWPSQFIPVYPSPSQFIPVHPNNPYWCLSMVPVHPSPSQSLPVHPSTAQSPPYLLPLPSQRRFSSVFSAPTELSRLAMLPAHQ